MNKPETIPKRKTSRATKTNIKRLIYNIDSDTKCLFSFVVDDLQNTFEDICKEELKHDLTAENPDKPLKSKRLYNRLVAAHNKLGALLEDFPATKYQFFNEAPKIGVDVGSSKAATKVLYAGLNPDGSLMVSKILNQEEDQEYGF